MTAAVGFPTLRLIRYAIGDWTLEQLDPGDSQILDVQVNIPRKPYSPSKSGSKYSSTSKRRNSRPANQKGNGNRIRDNNR